MQDINDPVAWLLLAKFESTRIVRSYKPNAYDSELWELHPLYTSPDQSARVAEISQSERNCLEAEIVNRGKRIDEVTKQMTEIASAHTHLLIEHQALKEQLAAMQAKREPLSDADIIGITKSFTDDRNFDYYIDFAREIEAAHGITGGK